MSDTDKICSGLQVNAIQFNKKLSPFVQKYFIFTF